jgi:hypothetical protein
MILYPYAHESWTRSKDEARTPTHQKDTKSEMLRMLRDRPATQQT